MKKILIANRGEVARRIIASCRLLELESVAVYSEPDRRSPHIDEADIAALLPGSNAEETYLNQDAVIDAAIQFGADAIHPGFGFLAENEQFATRCAAAGIKFIGPNAETMRLAGDKGAARGVALAAGVPVIPGYNGEDNSDQMLQEMADSCGYPILIKAAAGGGGKGMRRAGGPAEFPAAAAAARREAARAFGDDRLIVERDIAPARHVEVQLLGDSRGKVVHLFERECSFQRRFQKIIEESPAIDLKADVLAGLQAAAVALGQAIKLENAATVEFLLPCRPKQGEPRFYFIEINPRLQVEHPVTEARTGIDIVAWQIKVARGEGIDFDPKKLKPKGHAIEVRLYAEVPEDNFLPAVGTIRYFDFPPHTEFTPGGPADLLRIDHGLRRGIEISTRYDPMIGKIIARGNDRAEAVERIRIGLNSTIISGVDTNIPFLLQALNLPVPIDTTYLDRSNLTAACRGSLGFEPDEIAAAAAAFHAGFAILNGSADPFFTAPLWRDLRLTAGDLSKDTFVKRAVRLESRPLDIHTEFSVRLTKIEPKNKSVIFTAEVERNGNSRTIDLEIAPEPKNETSPLHRVISIGRRCRTATVVPADIPVETRVTGAESRSGSIEISGYGINYLIDHGFGQTYRDTAAPDGNGSIVSITAPLPGTVVSIRAVAGDEVGPGQILATIESMKMEHPISAPCGGTLVLVAVETGAQVKDGLELFQIAQSSRKVNPRAIK